MKKQQRIPKERLRRNESGMALIFALAFLAILAVIVIGFVGNATVESKIAFNNNSRTQASALAEAAVERALVNLTVISENEEFPFTPLSAEDVYTGDWSDPSPVGYDYSKIIF